MRRIGFGAARHFSSSENSVLCAVAMLLHPHHSSEGTPMRRLIVALGAAVIVAGCGDDVAGPAAGPRGPILEEGLAGCPDDAICLEPIVVIGDPGGDGGSWSGGGGDDGGTSDPGGRQCMSSVDVDEQALQGCTSGGGEPPDPGDEDESTICPQPFLGNVQPALITVAGRNHEFQFHSSLTYPFRRLTGGRSPATYEIGLPTTSKDAWWIAERGTITVWCRGAWITRTHWVGTLTVVDSDLHMVMGPGHPDF
jgi:hypothetical protein